MALFPVLTQTYTAADVRREWVYASDLPRSLTYQDYVLSTGALIGQAAVNDAPDADGRPDGQVLYEAQEGTTRVRVLNQVGADPLLSVEENYYQEPAVTCDLYCNVQVVGRAILLDVGTSYGPWESSIDNSNWTAARTRYDALPTGPGLVYVRDQGDGTNRCTLTRSYTIGAASTPAGDLIDTFTDDQGVEHNLYYTTGPRLVQDYTTPPTPEVLGVTQAERGRADGEVFSGRCEGTTRVDFAALLTPPYASIILTADAPFCGAPVFGACTLQITGVTVTPESAQGKDATATVLTSGAQGDLLYSLDRFETPGQTSPTFDGLLSGRHLVTVKENRVDGCLAELEFTTAAAYGLRYTVPFFCPEYQEDAEVRISLRGYTGEPEVLEGQAETAVITWEGNATDHVADNPVQASTLDINLLVMQEDQLRDAFAPDDRYAKAELWIGGTLEWSGWLTPQLYDAAHLAPPFYMTLRATDGLAGLKEIPFTTASGAKLSGTFSDLDLLRRCLEVLDYALPLTTSVSLYAYGMTTLAADDPLAQVYTYAQGLTDNGKPMSCRDVLALVLSRYNAQLRQEEGTWWVERISEVARQTTRRRRYDATGARLPGVTTESLLRVISDPEDELPWVTAAQRLQLLPAVSAVEINTEPGGILNLLPGTDWSEAAFLPGPAALVYWSGRAAVARQAPAKKGEPAGLRFTGTDFNAWVQSPPAAVGNVRDDFRLPGMMTLTITATFDRDLQIPDGPEIDEPAPGFPASSYPVLQYAIQVGNQWIQSPSGLGNTPHRFEVRLFQLLKPVTFTIPFLVEPNTVSVRLYSTKDMVITGLRLTNGEATVEERTDLYRARNTQAGRLIQVDDRLALKGSDTPGSLVDRTPLLANGTPTQRWGELGTDLLAGKELGDLLAAERLLWQQRPVQVLTGVLMGRLRVRNTITDPQELRPRGYKQTAHVWSVAQGFHTVTLVELLGTYIGIPPRPDGLLLLEDGGALLLEDNSYFLLEDA
ncbi:hypothetical protein LJY25_14810 [Hymenobacter sp. BT175]|uniref:hypothetical protein n=1 Tax=Hymenobacter translucens TaxID=2886507 RepID=UPI001D0DC632|nr:hypothetical protein [Hymenobacter translucens]MCC2547724.1 hypothetical protein [Hymenobacter translucens]